MKNIKLIHDMIIVFGATGYTGELVARYLAANAPGTLRWAVAGRDHRKLTALVSTFEKKVDVLVADVTQQTALDSLVGQTQVLVSTVGPFLKYGLPLVETCVRMGTHYIDCTGETPFVKRSSDQFHRIAVEKKLFIVHCCGYDCVPSDMGVYYLAHEMQRRHGEPLKKAHFSVYSAKGNVSAGTIRSALNLLTEESWQTLKNSISPFYLVQSTSDKNELPEAPKNAFLSFNTQLNMWQGMYVMGPVDTAIIYRSWSLLNRSYGAKMVYTNAMAFSSMILTVLTSLAFVLVSFLLAILPFKKTVLNALPTPKNQPHSSLSDHHFKVLMTGSSQSHNLSLDVVSKEDGGYLGTARYMAECAMLLVTQKNQIGKHPLFKVELSGGVLTPASAFGMLLVNKLNASDKISFKIRAP